MADIEKTSENNQVAEFGNNQIPEYVKVLIELFEAQFLRACKSKKIRSSQFDFRYPFILKEKDVLDFDDCIKNRLKERYNDNYELKFQCEVEYRNNDKFQYDNIDDLFKATHEVAMLRVIFKWKYVVKEIVDSREVYIDYDVVIFYEVEQKTDQNEAFLLEEYGEILVEGGSDDWNNATLSKLKILTNNTKMPFWWHYPRKLLLYLREYINLWIWFAVAASFFAIILPFIFDNDPEYEAVKTERIALLEERAKLLQAERDTFIEYSQTITDVSEKLQAFIEFSLNPSKIPEADLPPWPEDKYNWFLYYFLTFVIAGTITILILKGSRYIFPKSMILIGSNKSKLENKYRVYIFIWGAVCAGALVWIGSIIIKAFVS